MIKRAKEALSKKDRERYKTLGEEMYKDIDFTAEKYDLQTTINEASDYITESILSGQHPSTLLDSEKKIMEETKGKQWTKCFGYTLKDEYEIDTFPVFPIKEKKITT